MKKKVILCVFILMSSMGFAEEREQGFSGSISVGAGVRHIKSNLSPLADNRYLSSYSNKNSDLAAVPLLGFELYYRDLVKDNELYFKNYNGRDLSGLSLGAAFHYPSYIDDISLVSSFREKAYANPYLLGKREEVDVNKYGVKLSRSFLFDERQKFIASYTFIKNDYEKELMPYSNLKRKGFAHQLELGYQHTFFGAGIHYDYNDAKGKASSYSRYGLSLKTNLVFLNDHIFTPSLSYSYQKAVGTDFVFNQKQAGNIFKLNLNLVKKSILGYAELYGFANYGFEKRSNDISFYDETYQFLLVGMGYRF